MSEALKILVIDDQIGVVGSASYKAFMNGYGRLGYEFVFSTAAQERDSFTIRSALGSIEYYSDAALIFLDIKFGSESNRLGVDILSEAVPRYPHIPIVMMTSLEAEPATVVKCMRLGAKDYVTKGATPEELEEIIEKYARRVTESHLIIGHSPKMVALRNIIEKVAQSASVSTLIVGERGTGKELVARSIHFLGRRRNAPFVAVNCGAFPKDLLAAELFGAEKGAYTGAHRTKYGYIELANGGVLFLDEISEAPKEVQTSLLRVLESKTFRRLGVTEKEISVDFQLICATNRTDLADRVARESFRADLYDRIRGVEIRTPALRECAEDIEIIARHWLRDIQSGMGGVSYHFQGFTPEAIKAMRTYAWPGNVRELRNVIEGAMIRASGTMIDVADLPAELRGQPNAGPSGVNLPAEGVNLNETMARTELEYLSEAYETAGRNKAKTMQLYYPGYSPNYFDRIIFDAVKRCPAVLTGFPQFQDAYEKECQRRGKGEA